MIQLNSFAPGPQEIRCGAKVHRSGREFHFQFEINDPDAKVQDSLHDGSWSTWEREDELWRTTCLEAFWGVPGESGYWEINLSPAQERWNLYWFDRYREPQPPTPCF